MQGRMVCRGSWGDACLAYFAPHRVEIPEKSDNVVSKHLIHRGKTSLVDQGNFRKIHMHTMTVTSGWLPSLEELLTDDWYLYDDESLPGLRRLWELTEVMERQDCTQGQLVRTLSMQLTELGVEFKGEHTAGTDIVRLEIEAADLPEVSIAVKDRAYEWNFNFRGVPMSVLGEGRLEEELKAVRGHLAESRSTSPVYRYVFTLEVLTRAELPDDMELKTVLGRVERGELAGRANIEEFEGLAGKAAVEVITRLGSHPSWFGLDDNGNPAA